MNDTFLNSSYLSALFISLGGTSLVMIIYYVYYRMKYHQKMRFINHPYYSALLCNVIMQVCVACVYAFIPFEYTGMIFRVTGKTIWAISFVIFIILKKLGNQKCKKDAEN